MGVEVLSKAVSLGPRIVGFPMPKIDTGIKVMTNPFRRETTFPKSEPLVIRQAEVVAAAAWKKSELPRKPERLSSAKQSAPVNYPTQIASSFETPRNDNVMRPKVETLTAPLAMPFPKTESKVPAKLNKDIYVPVLPEQAEEVTAEKITVPQEDIEDQIHAKQSQKESVKRFKLVEAFKVTEKRKQTIKEALKKVAESVEENGKGFRLREIKKFLIWTTEHLSPLVRHKGRDGTIRLTNEALEFDLTEYSSKEEAEKNSLELVEKYKPVEEGEGEAVTIEEVRQVLEGKKVEDFRLKTPAEMVVRRIITKSEVVNRGQAVSAVSEEKLEPTLEDLNLTEIFPKAA